MGLDPTAHAPAAFGEGIYTREATERTYASLADRARVLLGLGETVVVDASFSTTAQRDLFRRVGEETSTPVTELVCTATPRELERRLLRRADVPDEHSDADLAIGRRLTAAADPWPQAVEVPTGETPKAETLERALRSLDA